MHSFRQAHSLCIAVARCRELVGATMVLRAAPRGVLRRSLAGRSKWHAVMFAATTTTNPLASPKEARQ